MAFRMQAVALVTLMLFSASAAGAQAVHQPGMHHKRHVHHAAGNDIYISKSNDDYLRAGALKDSGTSGPNDAYFQDTKEQPSDTLGSSFASYRGFDLLPENRPPF